MYNILVVDDSNTNLVLLDAVLSNRKFKVFTSSNVEDAYKVIGKENVQLILLDVLMPKIGGFEFLGELKKNKQFKHIPVIIVSAIGKHDNITMALELGAEAFFDKPVDIDSLIKKIEDILN